MMPAESSIDLMMEAIEMNHAKTCFELLCCHSHTVDIHYSDDLFLRKACVRGHLSLVKIFLDHGANLHVTNEWCLIAACTNGHQEVVELLLNRGANVNAVYGKPLSVAEAHKQTKILKLLLDRGAIAEFSVFGKAHEAKRWEICKDLIAANNSQHAIDHAILFVNRAVERENLPMLKFLLNNGAQIPDSINTDYRPIRLKAVDFVDSWKIYKSPHFLPEETRIRAKQDYNLFEVLDMNCDWTQILIATASSPGTNSASSRSTCQVSISLVREDFRIAASG